MGFISPLLAIGVVAADVAAADGPITILIHERAPYYVIESGQVGGIVAGPTADAFQAAGIEFAWREMASNRQLKFIEQNSEPVCATGWFKKPEREAFAKFTDAIYVDRPAVVLTRADNAGVIAHEAMTGILADATLRMGQKLGYSYGAFVDGAIAENGTPTVTTTQDNVGMVRMLLGRRFDYMIASFEEADGLIESVGAASADLIAVTMNDAPNGNARYILCSGRVDDGTIDALNEAIAEQRARDANEG